MISSCSRRNLALRWVLTCLSLAAASAAVAQTPPPTPWNAIDVGAPALTGSTTYRNGVFTVSAGGTAIAGREDQFHFVYQALTGDTTVVARIDSLTPADADSRIGLMIRGDLSTSAPHAFVYLNGSGGLGFSRRRWAWGRSYDTRWSSAQTPVWIAVKRQGTTLTAYAGTDSATWQTIASDTIALGTTAYVGLAGVARTSTTRLLADLSSVSLGSLPSGGGTLPNGQQAADIGSPTPAGRTTYSNGTYTMVAGGADIGGTSDQFHFVYQAVTGDVELVARVASVTAANSASKAGVMIRGSLASNAAYAYTLLNATAGYGFQWRGASGATTSATYGGGGTPPGWVRLVRSGQRFMSYRSWDGQNWTLVESIDVAMPSTVYVGLAATSRTTSASTTATISNLTVTNRSNTPPTVTLTAPVSGQSWTAPASVALAASATDPENRLSRVEFFANGALLGTDAAAPFETTWSNVAAGTYSLTATAYDADGGQAQSPAVSVVVNAPNQLPTVSITTPTTGQTWMAPATLSITANASDPEGRMARVEFFANGTAVGSDTASPYGMTWSNVPAGTYALTAVAYDADGGQRTSAPVTATVTANQPPTVALTTPTSGQTYTAPATVALAASASDPEGRLTRVEFYAGAVLLGSDTTAPYTFSWGSVPAGSYSVAALALDADGGRTVSTAVPIMVSTGGTTGTTWRAAFTASADHDTNVNGYRLNIFWPGTDTSTASPLATSDLGKPVPDSLRTITVDRTSFILALPAGNYIATITAIGPYGSTQSASASFAR